MTTNSKVFLDTNILIRSTISEAPDYSLVKPFVDGYIRDGHELWVSTQVIREYFVHITRPQSYMQPLTFEQTKQQYQKLKTIFKVAYETETTIDTLITLLESHPTGGKQIHDANIVASMIAYEIPLLITLNIADFKRFDNKINLVSPL